MQSCFFWIDRRAKLHVNVNVLNNCRLVLILWDSYEGGQAVIAAVMSITVSIGNFRLSSYYENELSVYKNYTVYVWRLF